jgi:hypothetical protein
MTIELERGYGTRDKKCSGHHDIPYLPTKVFLVWSTLTPHAAMWQWSRSTTMPVTASRLLVHEIEMFYWEYLCLAHLLLKRLKFTATKSSIDQPQVLSLFFIVMLITSNVTLMFGFS